MTPLRMPFRLFAGLFALVAVLICAGAVFEQFGLSGAQPASRAWLVLLSVTFAFAARYFGYFAFTGLAPPRGPRTGLRTTLDVAFGIAATGTIVYLVWMSGVSVLAAAFLLVFARAMRSYWEHGAASARRRDAAQR